VGTAFSARPILAPPIPRLIRRRGSADSLCSAPICAKKSGKVFCHALGILDLHAGHLEANHSERHRDSMIIVGLDAGRLQLRRLDLQTIVIGGHAFAPKRRNSATMVRNAIAFHDDE